MSPKKSSPGWSPVVGFCSAARSRSRRAAGGRCENYFSAPTCCSFPIPILFEIRRNGFSVCAGQGHSQGNEAGHLPMGPDDSTSASSLKKSFSLDLMSEDTPDVLAGGDFATWTTFPSVTSCHQYQGILVAMDQRKNAITTSTLSDPENNWRDYLCVTPEEEEQETVMSLWASAHIAESVMACGDRLDPKVPLYDSYARQHPIFPLHMAEEDLMEHISLLLQGNKDAVSPFSASVTTSLIICRLMGFISTDCQKQNLAIPESYFS
ncbi:uncharacterized protein LOC132533932 isoform X2 [Erinaceus europaeus]|uniref:Uncharacterized protein LOC132533932 isoform X2 n=1 Tax=Erinaceus europaeus TaxID=9365 RepID=A0ABM3W9E4_ERIEU|nr:uncharacterized protein LOC132533932 isoform X2 [Erinaceus europaeus]